MPRHSSRRRSTNAHTTAHLDSTVEKKLLGYAALAGATGVGILALAQPAEAKIVYTATHQIIAPNTTLQLDLNGDGTNDFVFSNRFAGSPRRATSSFRTSAFLSISPAVQTNEVWGTDGLVSALPAGVKLGPGGKFAVSQFDMGGVSALDGNHPVYGGQWAPPAGSVKNHYVGLKFVINGQIHFGWARLSVEVRQTKDGGVKAVLTGYAYETEVNKPIETGKTSGPDVASAQPATLGQLALGAAGLVARRTEKEAVA
ncbi:MAG: hypothetical protein WAM04_09070 [Candidatus Sulfotelmatobacter sp.]